MKIRRKSFEDEEEKSNSVITICKAVSLQSLHAKYLKKIYFRFGASYKAQAKFFTTMKKSFEKKDPQELALKCASICATVTHTTQATLVFPVQLSRFK